MRPKILTDTFPERGTMMGYDTAFWIFAILAFGVVEACTTALVSLWFMVGGGVALVVSLFTDNIGWQVLAFAIVSAAALAVMVPFLTRRNSDQKSTLTNSPLLYVGKQGTVIRAVTPGLPGRVHVDGLDWQAKCDTPLPEGTVIRVTGAEGATLTVAVVQAAHT
jgi:membrane protein implicated in regulation of membrane protease activity